MDALRAAAAHPSWTSRVRDVHGFTLAEVLIALVLLGTAGIALTAVMARMTETNIQGHEDVFRHSVAVAVMESLLVHEYDELAVGTTVGTGPAGEAWTVTISDEASDLRRLEVDVVTDGRTTRLETLVADRF